MLSDFWNRVSQILILAAPVVLLIFGIDILPVVENLGELFTVLIPAGIVIIKDIIQIIRGWGSASAAGHSFVQYTRLKPAVVYELHSRRLAA